MSRHTKTLTRHPLGKLPTTPIPTKAGTGNGLPPLPPRHAPTGEQDENNPPPLPPRPAPAKVQKEDEPPPLPPRNLAKNSKRTGRIMRTSAPKISPDVIRLHPEPNPQHGPSKVEETEPSEISFSSAIHGTELGDDTGFDQPIIHGISHDGRTVYKMVALPSVHTTEALDTALANLLNSRQTVNSTTVSNKRAKDERNEREEDKDSSYDEESDGFSLSFESVAPLTTPLRSHEHRKPLVEHALVHGQITNSRRRRHVDPNQSSRRMSYSSDIPDSTLANLLVAAEDPRDDLLRRTPGHKQGLVTVREWTDVRGVDLVDMRTPTDASKEVSMSLLVTTDQNDPPSSTSRKVWAQAPLMRENTAVSLLIEPQDSSSLRAANSMEAAGIKHSYQGSGHDRVRRLLHRTAHPVGRHAQLLTDPENDKAKVERFRTFERFRGRKAEK